MGIKCFKVDPTHFNSKRKYQNKGFFAKEENKNQYIDYVSNRH